MLTNLTVPFLTVAYAVSSPSPPSPPSPTLEMAHHLYMAVQLFLLSIIFLYHGVRLHLRPSSPHTLSALLTHSPFPLTVLTALCLPVFISRATFALLNAVNLYQLTIQQQAETQLSGIKRVSGGAFALLSLWEIAPTTLVLAYFHHIPGRRRGAGVGVKGKWTACPCVRGWRVETGDEGYVRGEEEGSERSGSPESGSHLSHGDDLEQELLYSQQGEAALSRSISGSHGGGAVGVGGSMLTTPLSPALSPASLLQSTSSLSSYTAEVGGPTRPHSSHPTPVLSASTSALSTLWHPRAHPPSTPPLIQPQLGRVGGGAGRGVRGLPPPPSSEVLSFSPPFLPFQSFQSPPLLSPSPSPSILSPSVGEDPRGYTAAAERWRHRQGGGGGAGSVDRAGRSLDEGDDGEYRYSASLDLDL